MSSRSIAVLFAIPFVSLALAAPAQAAKCGGDFNAFIAEFSREASARGISQGVIAAGLGNVTFDPAVLAFDRRQRGTFSKTFEQYAATRVGPAAHQSRQADDAEKRRALAAGRAALRRAEGTRGRDLDHGDRQRRRHGQAAGGAHARDAGA